MHPNPKKGAFFFDIMRCEKIIRIIENWAPKSVAWEKDNVGLQVGSLQKEIKNILLCLDVNEKVIEEAVSKNCNLIISHHPLLFRPLKKIEPEKDRISGIIEKLIKKDITLYSAHTNLDFTRSGVSFKLADKLELTNQKFLSNQTSNLNKLIVFVPIDYADKVAEAMYLAGAGIIGEYSNCSFRTTGTGTFRGSDKSNPTVGTKGKLEKVDEIRIGVIVDNFNLKNVIDQMLKAHPYEEVAYDVYPLKNENPNFGAGVIGELKQEISEREFLLHVSKVLKIKNFRFNHGSKSKIKKVAVCGGSGSDLLEVAIKNGADAFVTADIKYHTFQDAEGKILLIDAGHYETEILVLDEIKQRLEKSLTDKIKVFKYSDTTNPIIFFNN